MSFLARLKKMVAGTGRGIAVGGGTSPVRQKFDQFKEVLRCNNRALEIIADMGVKLSGDYVFDRHYAETSFEAISDAVLKSVHALNALCNNCYRDLYGVYDDITARLLRVVEQREDREGPVTLMLEEVTRDYGIIAGGKNGHLGQIAHDLRLPVPEGFVITTRAYHDVIDFNDLRDQVTRFEALIADMETPEEEIDGPREELRQRALEMRPPPGLMSEIGSRLQRLKAAFGDDLRLAVRSSAREEDMDFSFAGQYETVLAVAADVDSVFDAYRRVVASLFCPHAVRYRRTVLPGEGQVAMAVGCQRMIDAAASGILYTEYPSDPGADVILIVANWGQGEAIAKGEVPTDAFTVARTPALEIRDRQIAEKTRGLYPAGEGGLAYRPIAEDDRRRPCLRDDQIRELARMALRLENYFKHPQDVEWALSDDGQLYILQSRRLVLQERRPQEKSLPDLLEKYEVISRERGKVAQMGIGAGPVSIIRGYEELDRIPEGAVLVSTRDMPRFALVMDRVSAVVTEVGTRVSHMATICREFGVPCLVNVEGILERVEEGMEITVDAEDRCIYKGRVAELLAYRDSESLNVFESPAFRLLRRILNMVTPLNLVDPLLEEFSLDRCRSYHDILRYVHEKAVQEMVRLGHDERQLLKNHLKRDLDLPIPTGIIVIDIGGGLRPEAPPDRVGFTDITSIPLKAVLEGMLFPDVWHRESMNVGFRDMVTSIVNAPADSLSGQYSGHNIAIVTGEYVNLSLRFGYHFNILDAFCGEVTRDNHLYFRFVGGATDISKRSRRARLIAEILEAFDLHVQTRGDVVTGRLGGLARRDMEHTLNILGRLIGFTRQLDVCMDSDEVVSRYVEAFLNGDYGIVRADLG